MKAKWLRQLGLRQGVPVTAITVSGIAIILVTAVLLVSWAGYDVAKRNTVELTREKAELLIGEVVQRVRSQLDPVRTQVEYIGEIIANGRVNINDHEALGEALLAALAATPQVNGLGFANEDLQIIRVFRNRPDAPISFDDWSDDPHLKAAISEARSSVGAYWGELFFAEAAGYTLINLRMPVFSDGRFLGILVAVVSIKDLSAIVSDLGSLAAEYSVNNIFVLYDRQYVLAHPLFEWGFPGLSDAHPLPSITEFGDPVLIAMVTPEDQRPVIPEFAGRFQARGFDLAGQRYVALYQDLDEFGEKTWTVGAYLRVKDIAPQIGRLERLLIFVGAVLLVSLALGMTFGRGLSKPIKRLAAAAKPVRNLDFAGTPVLQYGLFRELNEAADAYNSMVRGLKSFETYVPRPLVRRLIRQHGEAAVTSEEREVTVLFTDIAGFTSLAESLSAPEVARFLNEHFTLLANCVEAEGGIVDKYIGDALMAFWGAPEEQEDAAMRACRAALAIARTLKGDNMRRLAEGKPAVKVRVGIHTGPVVVGNIGSPDRVNYTIVGDTVNVTQRLEAMCKKLSRGEATTILISAATRMKLDPGFVAEPVGELEVRGRAQEIEAYRLLESE